MDLTRATDAKPIMLSPATYNEIVDRLKKMQADIAAMQRRLGGKTPFDGGCIWVQNEGEATIELGQIVGINSPQVTDADMEAYVSMMLTSGACFNAETPAASSHAGRIAVAIEPIPSGFAGRCRMQGICLAWVDITDNSHEYADADDGGDHLASGESGPAQIIHPAPGGGGTAAGETLCLVRLSNQQEPLDPPNIYGVLNEDLTMGDSAELQIHDADGETEETVEVFDNVLTADVYLAVERFVWAIWHRVDQRYYVIQPRGCADPVEEE